MTNFQLSPDPAAYGAVTTRFPHGLLVVGDAESEDEHEEWDPTSEAVHAGRDSLFISVRPAESGPVGIVCIEGPQELDDLQLVFSGEIVLTRPNISLAEPGGTMNLELPIERKHNGIEVFSDDNFFASRILLVVSDPIAKSRTITPPQESS
jgi:hypothetical protein